MIQVVDLVLDKDCKVGFAVMDAERTVESVNPEMINMFETIAPGSRFPEHAAANRLISASLAEGRALSELVTVAAGGRERAVCLYVQPRRSWNKTAVILLMAWEMEGAGNQLHQLTKEVRLHTIGAMAAGTANAVLNPLTVVNGTLQLLEKQLDHPPIAAGIPSLAPRQRHDHYFRILYEQIDSIEHTMRRFLLLGKPTEIDAVPICVVRFLHRILPDLQHEAISRNIRFTCEYPHEYSKVLANEQYLKEIFRELLANALDATPAGGSVILRVESGEREIRFYVIDGGAGIKWNILPHVTEPFYTTKDQAMGFGLSYCESVIHKLGGELHIDSGESGTSVQFALPRIPLGEGE